jgi:pimeloyl-ACP methyl ester carboxylesterase
VLAFPTRLMPLVVKVIIVACAALWLQRVVGAYLKERDELEARLPTDDLARARRKLPQLREVSWKLDGGQVQYAWYLPSANGAVIVYVHGSPGSRGSLFPEAVAFAGRGYGALLLDLPGYGKSEGERHWNASFVESVRRAVDFAAAQPEVDSRRLAGFGYSMGTAIVAQAAAADGRLRALVLVSAFTRLEDQLRYQFRTRVPGAAGAAVLAARNAGVSVDALDTQAAVRKLGARPLLFVAGELDSAIPLSMPQSLAQSAPRADLYVAKGVGHAGFLQLLGSPYVERLARFLTARLDDGSWREGDAVHSE